VKMRDRTVGAVVAEVESALGAEAFAEIVAINRCLPGEDLPTLRALRDVCERQLLAPIMRGCSPAGSVGEAFDKLVDAYGPQRLHDAVAVAEMLQHLDASGTAVVRRVAEMELARTQAPKSEAPN